MHMEDSSKKQRGVEGISNSLVKLMSVFVQAYIWRCDYPIEMGFAPKDV